MRKWVPEIAESFHVTLVEALPNVSLESYLYERFPKIHRIFTGIDVRLESNLFSQISYLARDI